MINPPSAEGEDPIPPSDVLLTIKTDYTVGSPDSEDILSLTPAFNRQRDVWVTGFIQVWMEGGFVTLQQLKDYLELNYGVAYIVVQQGTDPSTGSP